MVKTSRKEWPLWAQARHAHRYPHLWTTEELRSLLMALKGN